MSADTKCICPCAKTGKCAAQCECVCKDCICAQKAIESACSKEAPICDRCKNENCICEKVASCGCKSASCACNEGSECTCLGYFCKCYCKPTSSKYTCESYYSDESTYSKPSCSACSNEGKSGNDCKCTDDGEVWYCSDGGVSICGCYDCFCKDCSCQEGEFGLCECSCGNPA